MSTAIKIEGASNVSIKGNTIAGFETAIDAKDADGLHLADNKIDGPGKQRGGVWATLKNSASLAAIILRLGSLDQ